jgi:hypothetical protein
MTPDSLQPYDFYSHELQAQTQNVFCRNWMELNANFGLQGEFRWKIKILPYGNVEP